MINKYNLGDKVRTKIYCENDKRTEVDATICGIEITDPNTNYIRYKIAFDPSDTEKAMGCTGCNGYVGEEDIIGSIPNLDSNVSKPRKDMRDLCTKNNESMRLHKISFDIDIHCCDADFTIPYASDAGLERCSYGYHGNCEVKSLFRQFCFADVVMYLAKFNIICTNKSDPIFSKLRELIISFEKEIITSINDRSDRSSVLVTIDNGKLDGTTLQASFYGFSYDK